MAQSKLGALRGIKAIKATAYLYDSATDTYTLDTKSWVLRDIQTAAQEIDITEGDKSSLTGSGKNIITVKDPDQLNGFNLTFTSSLIRLDVAQVLVGGTTTLGTGADATKVVSWEPPIDATQIPHIALDIYTQNYEGDNQPSGFQKISMPWTQCGYPSIPEQTEKDWLKMQWKAYSTKKGNSAPVKYAFISTTQYDTETNVGGTNPDITVISRY